MTFKPVQAVSSHSPLNRNVAETADHDVKVNKMTEKKANASWDGFSSEDADSESLSGHLAAGTTTSSTQARSRRGSNKR